MHLHDEPEDLPDLTLGALSLWVHERQFPEQSDWDAGWLLASAVCQSRFGRVALLRDPFLHADDLQRWLGELERLRDGAADRADLTCNDKVLAVQLAAAKDRDELAVAIAIRPDLDAEVHHYSGVATREQLADAITTLRMVLATHEPQDGWPEEA